MRREHWEGGGPVREIVRGCGYGSASQGELKRISSLSVFTEIHVQASEARAWMNPVRACRTAVGCMQLTELGLHEAGWSPSEDLPAQLFCRARFFSIAVFFNASPSPTSSSTLQSFSDPWRLQRLEINYCRRVQWFLFSSSASAAYFATGEEVRFAPMARRQPACSTHNANEQAAMLQGKIYPLLHQHTPFT
jgi:hypothetical protein